MFVCKQDYKIIIFFRQERNIIEAASNGATQSISLIAIFAVNLIAFIALIEFLNQTLIWIGNRVGFEKPGDEITFQVWEMYISWILKIETLFKTLYKFGLLHSIRTSLNSLNNVKDIKGSILSRMIFDQCFLLQFLCSYVIYPVAFHIVFYYSLCGFPHCILLQFLCSYVF